MKEKFPTIILRIIIILAIVAGSIVCIFLIPALGEAMVKNFPKHVLWRYPLVVGLYITMGCLFFSLFQFWLLLNNLVNSYTVAIKNIRSIRSTAIVFSILYCLFVMPLIYLIAEANDAPGLVLIWAFFNLIPLGIAAFMTIFEQICRKTRC